jgi:antitoxin ParD1/3/4
MNVSLTPELERLIQRRVKSGLYGSASEVVREALRRLEESEAARNARLAALRQDLDVGIRELDAGLGRPLNQAALQRLKQEARSRSQSRRPGRT